MANMIQNGSSTPHDPLGELKGIILQGDSHLLEGEWIQAAQLYNTAARDFEDQKNDQASVFLRGFHHLSAGLAAYFEEGATEAIAPLYRAVSAFKNAGIEDQHEFARGLYLGVQADAAARKEEYEPAGKFLESALEALSAVRSRNAVLSRPCEFWLRWFPLRVHYEWLSDYIEERGIEAGQLKLEEIQSLSRELTKLSPNEATKGLYGGYAALSLGVFIFGKIEKAVDDEDEHAALQVVSDARKAFLEARGSFEKLSLPGGVNDMAGGAEYLMALADAVASRLRAEQASKVGDRVAAIRITKDSVKSLKGKREEAEQPQSLLQGSIADIDEQIEEAEAYLKRLLRDEPGLLELESCTRKLAGPNLSDEVMRDYYELTNSVMNRAWLGVVVLSGAVLEGILTGVLQSRISEADSWSGAPKEGGTVKQIESWVLGDLLRFAEHCKLLSADELHLSNATREFRNLIHPGKRVRQKISVGKPEGEAAVSALKLAVTRLAR